MITHIKIGPHKILRRTELQGLGRVTVLTGRNSAGKTTVLEAIYDNDTRVDGRLLGTADLPVLEGFVVQYAGEKPRHQAQAIRTGLENVCGSRAAWYSDDGPEFAEQISQASGPALSNWNRGGFKVAFGALLQTSPRIVFVPPKRQLVTPAVINAGEGLDATGNGVLNALFFCQSQLPDTDEAVMYQEIRKAFEDITLGLSFQLVLLKNSYVDLQIRVEDGRFVPAGDCGLGLRDLLLHLYFASAPQYDLVMIEEPENHLHPAMQRRFLSYCAGREDRQFFISTHSNVFLDPTFVDKVFAVRNTGTITVSDATGRAAILSDLGYSVADNLVSDMVILVEGPTDVPVLEELLTKLGLMSRYSIKLWPLGGDIMDQLDLSVFAGPYHVMALVDRDPGSERVRQRFEKRCRDAGVAVHRLHRRTIEHYFSLRVLREVFKGRIQETVASIDEQLPLAEQLGFEVKNSNRKLAREMSLDELAGTDLLGFLGRVAARLDGTGVSA